MEECLSIIDRLMVRDTHDKTVKAHVKLIISMLQGVSVFDDKEELSSIIEQLQSLYKYEV